MPETTKKTNMDRLLSLAVRIKDPEAAKEVWESFKDAKLLAGCQILSMGNGNYAEERDKIDELLPANKATIGLHFLFGLLLVIGYVLDVVF